MILNELRGLYSTRFLQQRERATHLSCGHKVFDGVDTQTQDVIRVLRVELLGVLVPVVNNAGGSYVVHHLTILGVE